MFTLICAPVAWEGKYLAWGLGLASGSHCVVTGREGSRGLRALNPDVIVVLPGYWSSVERSRDEDTTRVFEKLVSRFDPQIRILLGDERDDMQVIGTAEGVAHLLALADDRGRRAPAPA